MKFTEQFIRETLDAMMKLEGRGRPIQPVGYEPRELAASIGWHNRQ